MPYHLYSQEVYEYEYSEVSNKYTVSTINFSVSFRPVWSSFQTVLQLILLIQTCLNLVSDSLDISLLIIQECFDRKQLRFS